MSASPVGQAGRACRGPPSSRAPIQQSAHSAESNLHPQPSRAEVSQPSSRLTQHSRPNTALPFLSLIPGMQTYIRLQNPDKANTNRLIFVSLPFDFCKLLLTKEMYICQQKVNCQQLLQYFEIFISNFVNLDQCLQYLSEAPGAGRNSCEIAMQASVIHRIGVS